jgi:hypothetical protein
MKFMKGAEPKVELALNVSRMKRCVKLRRVKTRIFDCALLALFLGLPLAACTGEPDPRTLPGMLEYAARAIERNDAPALFRVIDARSRHAMASIVEDRRAAAALIRNTYPEDQRDEAIRELGSAAQATDAAALFADRCDRACMADLGGRIGAPLSQRQDGDELVVETPRGGTLRVTGGGDDWFGIVWRYDELDRERQRANQDRLLVEANARTYQLRSEQAAALDGEAPTGEEHPVPPHDRSGDRPAATDREPAPEGAVEER